MLLRRTRRYRRRLRDSAPVGGFGGKLDLFAGLTQQILRARGVAAELGVVRILRFTQPLERLRHQPLRRRRMAVARRAALPASCSATTASNREASIRIRTYRSHIGRLWPHRKTVFPSSPQRGHS
ncbi:MAG: hypothetical protein IAE86_10325, partial [Burkholderiaceae bacterium]|nr:hypothetical protein [Burkholderiaceae bacterium]